MAARHVALCPIEKCASGVIDRKSRPHPTCRSPYMSSRWRQNEDVKAAQVYCVGHYFVQQTRHWRIISTGQTRSVKSHWLNHVTIVLCIAYLTWSCGQDP